MRFKSFLAILTIAADFFILLVNSVNAYDVMGRQTSVSKTFNSAGYTTNYGYDLSGKPISMTYPDNYHVIYGYYPGSGLLHTVIGITDMTGYATISNYEPTGKIGLMDHGNGTSTTQAERLLIMS